MSWKKKVLITSIILLAFIVLITVYIRSHSQKTTSLLEQKLKNEWINNNLSDKNSIPGITCRERKKGHWEIKVTTSTPKECDLSALSSLPKENVYDIWLTIPGGSLKPLNKINVRSIYIDKIGKDGNFDLSLLAKNKKIKNLSLVSISTRDIESLPELPELVNLSVHFRQKSAFDFSIINKDVKIKHLSFTNVDRFICKKQHLLHNLYSLGLLKSDASVLKYISVEQLVILGMKLDINNLVKYQNALKILILKDCTLVNPESFSALKGLEKLVINNCKPINRDIIRKLPFKKVIILP